MFLDHMFTRCLRCGRQLSFPASVKRGYGNYCWQKVNQVATEMQSDFKPTIINSEEAEESRRKILLKIDQLEFPHNECHCGNPIKKGILCSYDHDGGIQVKGYATKQWFYIHCEKCKYDYSIRKLGIYSVE